MRYLLAFIIVLIGFNGSLFAQTRTLDSLRKLLGKKDLQDTLRIMVTLEVAYEMRYTKSDSSLKLTKQASKKANELKFLKGIGMSLYVEGIWFSLKGKYQEALENYFRSLDIYEKIKFDKGTARTLNNIAIVYYYQKNYEKADVFLKKSLSLNEKIKNYPEIARALNNLGRNLLERNKPQDALSHFRNSLAILDKHNISSDVSVYFCNVAEALYQLKRPKEALENAQKSLEIAKKMSNKRVEARANIIEGAIYLELNEIEKAKKSLERGTPIAHNLKFPEEHLLALEYSYRLYEKIKNYEKAYLFLKDYKAYSDTVSNETNYKIALQREYEYNDQKRKIERQNEIGIRYSLMGGVALALGLVFFALRAFRIKAKAFRIISKQQEELQVMNEELMQNQEEIVTQRNFIEAQNKSLSLQNDQIKQSITTALTIQQALLPFDNRLMGILREYFVIYMPRDIVSGDFYWIERVENKTIVIVADCTGHGVPGAFMSLVAINLLEKIVLQQEITSPAQILHNLHELIRIALKQDEFGNNTGMDLGITTIEDAQEGKKLLHFAGAKRPLYYLDAENPQKIQVLKGNRKSVGGLQNDRIDFVQEALTLPTNSIFYMSSDGLADQNDEQRKRLRDEPIWEVLLQHEKSLPAQKKAIQDLLESHMKNTIQRDDILFLGVRV